MDKSLTAPCRLAAHCQRNTAAQQPSRAAAPQARERSAGAAAPTGGTAGIYAPPTLLAAPLPPPPPPSFWRRGSAPRGAQRTRRKRQLPRPPRRATAAAGEAAAGLLRADRGARRAPAPPPAPTTTEARAGNTGRAAGHDAQQRPRAQGSGHPRGGQPPGRNARGARSRPRTKAARAGGHRLKFSPPCGGEPTRPPSPNGALTLCATIRDLGSACPSPH